jgi:hypothetical protein
MIVSCITGHIKKQFAPTAQPTDEDAYLWP